MADEKEMVPSEAGAEMAPPGAAPGTPGGGAKKRSRSKDSKRTGLTPEAKNRALESGKMVTIKPKKKALASASKSTPTTSSTSKTKKPEVKSGRVELRLFKDVGGGKTHLRRTDWRKLKDEINQEIATTSNLAMMEGLVKSVHNANDKNEPTQYGAFVYEKKEQLDNLFEMLSKIELEFGIVMSMPGTGKETKSKLPTIELKMTSNKHIQEGQMFEVIRRQNNLKGKFVSKSYKDYGILRVYTIIPSKEMLEDITARGLEVFKFGLDAYAIVIKNPKAENNVMAENNTMAESDAKAGCNETEGKMDTN